MSVTFGCFAHANTLTAPGFEVQGQRTGRTLSTYAVLASQSSRVLTEQTDE